MARLYKRLCVALSHSKICIGTSAGLGALAGLALAKRLVGASGALAALPLWRGLAAGCGVFGGCGLAVAGRLALATEARATFFRLRLARCRVGGRAEG